jgi:predicted secreted protein
MVASAQQVVALNSLHFGLADATRKKLEEQRIAAAYANLTERVAAIAKAMGRNPSDALLDTLDFEASGVYPREEVQSMKAMRAASADSMHVEEPRFEPGETTLNTRVIAKVRFQ